MDHFEPNIAFPASLIGEPNRARILMALCGGEQRAGSLAQIVSASPQAASNRLALLVSGGLVCAGSDGRHRYYRLASPEIARILELLAALAPPVPAVPHGRVDRTLFLFYYAGTCATIIWLARWVWHWRTLWLAMEYCLGRGARTASVTGV
ncbi:MAG: hypothetical protein CBARDMAM_2859 [uncultured Caballeronia sp.]|nr:MAG: hypothetical protein CBARDMAM_2859 [uncultured Caballeronia sp.]